MAGSQGCARCYRRHCPTLGPWRSDCTAQGDENVLARELAHADCDQAVAERNRVIERAARWSVTGPRPPCRSPDRLCPMDRLLGKLVRVTVRAPPIIESLVVIQGILATTDERFLCLEQAFVLPVVAPHPKQPLVPSPCALFVVPLTEVILVVEVIGGPDLESKP